MRNNFAGEVHNAHEIHFEGLMPLFQRRLHERLCRRPRCICYTDIHPAVFVYDVFNEFLHRRLITHIEGVRDGLDHVITVRYDASAAASVVEAELGGSLSEVLELVTAGVG